MWNCGVQYEYSSPSHLQQWDRGRQPVAFFLRWGVLALVLLAVGTGRAWAQAICDVRCAMRCAM